LNQENRFSMLRASPMPHLQTYARLHVAGPNDISALRELSTSLRGDGRTPDRNWPPDAMRRDSLIVVATECQATVGAVEVIHPADGAVATLAWLGVARWARGRGVGKLLIESAIEHARSEGAAALRIGSMALSASSLDLAAESGFVERAYDETQIVFERSLWDARNARQTPNGPPHFYGSSSSLRPSAAALMVAMATIDSRFMMTPEVERVIAAEIDHHEGADAEVLLGVANAAVRRSFDVGITALCRPLSSGVGTSEKGTSRLLQACRRPSGSLGFSRSGRSRC
jgi:GNAT superfamily N-acetyltransferase